MVQKIKSFTFQFVFVYPELSIKIVDCEKENVCMEIRKYIYKRYERTNGVEGHYLFLNFL
jgi:hypothetical protein